MARPTIYDFELCKEICIKLYDVEKYPNLSSVLKSDKRYPARSTFFEWKREYPELSDLYVKIQQDRGELFIEEIDQHQQDLRNGIIEPSVANVLIQTLKWKAAKFYPKMFGDNKNVDLTTNGKSLNIPILSIDPLSDDKDDNGTKENS